MAGRRKRLERSQKFEASIVCVVIQAREQHLGAPKPREITHAHGVELADEVIALMLNDTGVKAFGFAFDGPALEIETLVSRLPHG